jgi:hypothetical protein
MRFPFWRAVAIENWFAHAYRALNAASVAFLKRSPVYEARTMEKKRPIAITVICIIGFIGAAVVLPLNLYALLQGDRTWYPLLSIVNGALGLATIIGLWMMKKWSVIVYTATYVITLLVLLATGRWSLVGLIVPLVVIIIGFYYYRQMD